MEETFGAHVSSAGGLHTAFERAEKLGATVFQTHPTSPKSWSKIQLQDQDAYLKASSDHEKLTHWFHAPYLINLGTSKTEHLARSKDCLVDYLSWAEKLGVKGVIFHPGSHLGVGYQAILPELKSSVSEILERANANQALLVFEVCAGRGGTIGSLEELGSLLPAFPKNQVALCLDTCHLFDGGVDLHGEHAAENLLWALNNTGLLERAVCFHANNSKNPLGFQKDRHENIGQGYIGDKGFVTSPGFSKFQEPVLVQIVPI